MSNIDYTLWPNEGGTLGQIKVQIPDGVNTFWPEGDALVGNFVFNKGNLVGFVDTKALIANESKSTTFPYDYVNIQVDKSLEGVMTFNGCAKPEYLNVTYVEVKIRDNDDTGNNDDTVIVTTKYKGCKTLNDIKAVDPNYQTTDIIDGVWTEGLADLMNGSSMFNNCHHLESFSSDLSSLTNGYGMFEYCINLTSFTIDLSSLTDSFNMFYGCDNLTSFSSDLPSLTSAESMFYNCSNLTSFAAYLPSLTNGSKMFYNCSKLTSFSSELPSLTNGNSMFENCTNLISFTSDLSSLTDGSGMFSYTNLESFNGDLSSLTSGGSMFLACPNFTSFNGDLSSLTSGKNMFSGCPNFTSFNGDLSSLASGLWMFVGCSNLTTFSSNLSSLTNGKEMFYNCKLDTASVQNIADTINTVSNNNRIDIGIGNTTPNEQETTAFNTIASKGWTVYVNGSQYTPTSPAAITTLDENGEETVTPIPFWAKPVQSDEEHAQYVDEQGNFFNILGGQFIYGDDISTYGMFTCEEDAAANMRLTKIVK